MSLRARAGRQSVCASQRGPLIAGSVTAEVPCQAGAIGNMRKSCELIVESSGNTRQMCPAVATRMMDCVEANGQGIPTRH